MEQALLFIRQIQERFTVVPLTDQDYFMTIERLAAIGLAKSYIYDGLIVTAEARSNASVIYTWDIDDFKLVSPSQIANKIRIPPA